MNKPEDTQSGQQEPLVHTPGPWTYSPQREELGFVAQVWDTNGENLATLEMTDRANADVLLMANAPLLLKALRDIVRHQEIVGGSMPTATKLIAQNAIALVE